MEPWLLVVLLGLCVIGFALMRPGKAIESKQNLSDIEATLDVFLGDLEEENNKLLDRFIDMKKTSDLTISKLADKVQYLEKHIEMLSQSVSQLQSGGIISTSSATINDVPIEAPLTSEAVKHDDQNEKVEQIVKEKGSLNLKERYKLLFEYYSNGKSTEYIAKKLGMNKGEVSLILQLAKQEEQQRV